MFCYKCNSVLGNKDNYCSKCGTKKVDESIVQIDIMEVLNEAEEHLMNLSTEELTQEIINFIRNKETSPYLFWQNYCPKISLPILFKVNPLISVNYFIGKLGYGYHPTLAIKAKILDAFSFVEMRGLIFPEPKDFEQEWMEEHDPYHTAEPVDPWFQTYLVTSIFHRFNTWEEWPTKIDYDLIYIQLKSSLLLDSFENYVQKELLGITDEYWDKYSGILDKWNEIFFKIFDHRTLNNLYLYISKINGREIDVELFNKVISDLFNKKELYFVDEYDHNTPEHALKRE